MVETTWLQFDDQFEWKNECSFECWVADNFILEKPLALFNSRWACNELVFYFKQGITRIFYQKGKTKRLSPYVWINNNDHKMCVIEPSIFAMKDFYYDCVWFPYLKLIF